MKKIILPIFVFSLVVFATLFLMTQKTYAQAEPDCQITFDKELYECLQESGACTNSCVDKANKAMSLTVDGGKVNLECQRSICDPASEACNNKVKANFKTCLDARKAKENPPKEVAEKETSSGPGFIKINPVETWREIYNFLDNFIQLDKAIKDGRMMIGVTHLSVPSGDLDNPVLAPEIDEDGNLYDFLPGYVPHSIIEWGSANTYKEKTRLNDEKKNHFFEVRPGKSGQAVLKTPKDETGSYILEDGEIEVVKVSDYSESGIFNIQSPNGSFTVSHTHFLVKYDKETNQTTLVVYDGEVNVKTNDGQETTVTPKDGKLGAIVITQKLSPVKLAIAGLMLTGIIGGIVWFLKRTTSRKKSR